MLESSSGLPSAWGSSRIGLIGLTWWEQEFFPGWILRIFREKITSTSWAKKSTTSVCRYTAHCGGRPLHHFFATFSEKLTLRFIDGNNLAIQLMHQHLFWKGVKSERNIPLHIAWYLPPIPWASTGCCLRLRPRHALRPQKKTRKVTSTFPTKKPGLFPSWNPEAVWFLLGFY